MHDTIYRKVIKKSWLSLKWTHLINNRNIPDWKSRLSHVGNSSSIQIFAHNSETETFRCSHKHTCFHTYTFTHIQHRHSVTLKYTYKQHTWVLTLTHVPHVHSCSHTYAPTYSHTLKIPYYTHTQIHTTYTRVHTYAYIHTLLKISLHNILTCALTAIGTLFHTLTFSHTRRDIHTHIRTHSYMHFTYTHNIYTYTLTDSYANSSIHTHACTQSYIPSNTHSHTHSLLKVRLAPGFLWSSWWICNCSCFRVSISSALLELILNGSFSQIFQFKPFIFPRRFLVCIHNETWLE